MPITTASYDAADLAAFVERYQMGLLVYDDTADAMRTFCSRFAETCGPENDEPTEPGSLKTVPYPSEDDAAPRQSCALLPLTELSRMCVIAGAESPASDDDDIPDPLFSILLTSGSSGPPKGVAYGSLSWAVSTSAAVYPDTMSVSYQPLYHITDRHSVYCTLFSGGCVGVLPGVQSPDFFELVKAFGPTVFFGTVRVFQSLLQLRSGQSVRDEGADALGNRLKTVVCGAGSLQRQEEEGVALVTGADALVTGYGSTEFGNIARRFAWYGYRTQLNSGTSPAELCSEIVKLDEEMVFGETATPLRVLDDVELCVDLLPESVIQSEPLICTGKLWARRRTRSESAAVGFNRYLISADDTKAALRGQNHVSLVPDECHIPPCGTPVFHTSSDVDSRLGNWFEMKDVVSIAAFKAPGDMQDPGTTHTYDGSDVCLGLRVLGRSNTTIKLPNGTFLDPPSVEAALQRSPMIASAAVGTVGGGLPAAAVVLNSKEFPPEYLNSFNAALNVLCNAPPCLIAPDDRAGDALWHALARGRDAGSSALLRAVSAIAAREVAWVLRCESAGGAAGVSIPASRVCVVTPQQFHSILGPTLGVRRGAALTEWLGDALGHAAEPCTSRALSGTTSAEGGTTGHIVLRVYVGHINNMGVAAEGGACEAYGAHNMPLWKDVPFKELGGDSLACVRLVRDLKEHLPGGLHGVLDDIFIDLTRGGGSAATLVDRLTHAEESTGALRAAPMHPHHPDTPASVEPFAAELRQIREGGLAAQGSRDIPIRGGPRHWVVVSGATGFVGSHVVAQLLACGRHVRCVGVRSGGSSQADAAHSPTDALKARVVQAVWPILQKCLGAGDVSHILSERLDVIGGDITAPRGGLSVSDYADVAHEGTCFIHCAAAVMLSKSVSFEQLYAPNVQSTVVMAAMAHTSSKYWPEQPASILYVSTTDACALEAAVQASAPEEASAETVREELARYLGARAGAVRDGMERATHDLSAAVGRHGYAATKLTSELILEAYDRWQQQQVAGGRTDIRIARLRLVGPHLVSGACLPDDFTARVLRGVLHARAVPAGVGGVVCRFTPVCGVAAELAAWCGSAVSTSVSREVLEGEAVGEVVLTWDDVHDALTACGYRLARGAHEDGGGTPEPGVPEARLIRCVSLENFSACVSADTTNPLHLVWDPSMASVAPQAPQSTPRRAVVLAACVRFLRQQAYLPHE